MIKEFMSELKSLGPSFVMTIGLPGSGKDTYYNTYLKDYYTMISSDLIREEVFGDINDQTHNTEVFEIMFERTVRALNDNKSVYYNATNLSSRRRTNFLKTLKKRVKVDFNAEALIFAPYFENCCKNNLERERTVPQYVMNRMIKNFEPPYFNEGWDLIKKQYYDVNPAYLTDSLEETMGISHDNPHHILTLGAHMKMANILFESKYTNCLINKNKNDEDRRINLNISDYNIMHNAVLFHDLGKRFCKTFTNYKGEETNGIAHYYNHANVGAYMYLCVTGDYEEDLLVANLIADHMKFFNGEKAVEKLREKYGENFWMLEELHEFDTSAH